MLQNKSKKILKTRASITFAINFLFSNAGTDFKELIHYTMSTSSEQDDSSMEDEINEDINDSETESSESDDASNSEEEIRTKEIASKPTNVASVIEKYQKLKGKQLFLLFPKKLPEQKQEFERKVKSLNSLIRTAIKPRQKSSRYCLIEFDNESDCKKCMVELKNVEIDGKKLIVKIPKTDDEEFIKKIAATKAAKNLRQREKLKLKKLAKLEARKKTFTSTLIVSNIPSSATVADVKKLFPDAVELRFTLAKGVENTSTATVSLPTPRDASNAYRKKLKIEGIDLKINFAIPNKNIKEKKIKMKKEKENSEENINVTRTENAVKQKTAKKRTHDDVTNKDSSDQLVVDKKKMKLNKKKKNIPRTTNGKNIVVKKEV